MRIVRLARQIGAAMSVTLAWLPSPVSAAPDGGAIVRSTCGSCHTLARGKGAAEGPNLAGVVGRTAGSAPNFPYSPGFRKGLAGKTWTPQLLDKFLTDTEKLAPGANMTYFNDDPASRAAIIKYLSGL
ncbi:MAG: cytochrome C [Alphaproteobacteria bacterium]|nr:cytochrome C [Alphaproteobacteria bacterium]